MNEAVLVKKIIFSLTKEVGGLWIKISAGPSQVDGLPDIIGCCQGQFFGFEVKLPGREKTLKPLQIHWLNKISANGGCSHMITEPSQAVDIVKNKLNLT